MKFETPSLLSAAKKANEEGVSVEAIYRLIDHAAEEGALRVLRQIGLQDDDAGTDIHELRSLLEAWRDTKKTVRNTFITWLIRLFIGCLAIGLAVKLKILDLGF
jgi:hypothetical protein